MRELRPRAPRTPTCPRRHARPPVDGAPERRPRGRPRSSICRAPAHRETVARRAAPTPAARSSAFACGNRDERTGRTCPRAGGTAVRRRRRRPGARPSGGRRARRATSVPSRPRTSRRRSSGWRVKAAPSSPTTSDPRESRRRWTPRSSRRSRISAPFLPSRAPSASVSRRSSQVRFRSVASLTSATAFRACSRARSDEPPRSATLRPRSCRWSGRLTSSRLCIRAPPYSRRPRSRKSPVRVKPPTGALSPREPVW